MAKLVGGECEVSGGRKGERAGGVLLLNKRNKLTF